MINCLFNPWLLALLVIIVCICSQVCWGKRPGRWRNVSTIRQKWELSVVAFFLLQNSQYNSATVSLWPRIYSASSRSQHTLFTLCHCSNHHHHSKSLIDPSDMLHLIVGTSSLITQNFSSELFTSRSATDLNMPA